ncbi:MAG: isochorismate synthase [Balneolaceae bacterium]
MYNHRRQKAGTYIEEIDTRLLRDLLEAHHDKEWLSYSLSVQEIDPLSYLEKTGPGEQYYWEQPARRFAIASGGAAVILKATGANRFKEISEQSRQLKRKHIAASSANHALAEPVLLGGYSFSDHNIQNRWKNFGAARFLLPDWSLIRSGSTCLLTLTVRICGKKQDSLLNELERMIFSFKNRCRRIKTGNCSDSNPSYGNGDAGYRNSTGPGGNGSNGNGPDSRCSRNPDGRPDNSRHKYQLARPSNSFADWRKQVDRSMQMIADGTFQKIVIARHLDFQAEKPIRVPRVMDHLRHRFPECFNFMISAKNGPSFIGASPERLISLRRNKVLTEGLAGSTSRGNSTMEDVALGQALMESSKERSEHNFVVEDIRNTLRPFALRLDHRRQPVIKKLNNLQHLYTPIYAEIKKETSIHELAGNLHPTPAVGGFPKRSSVPYINEIEDMDRGWYAGPVGWFTFSGAGEFAVAIRSAWIDRRQARLYAGSGIVQDSNPEKEWNETEMKLSPVLNALKQATND